MRAKVTVMEKVGDFGLDRIPKGVSKNATEMRGGGNGEAFRGRHFATSSYIIYIYIHI